MGQIPAEMRIHIGDKYGLEEWLLSAYETLLDRSQTMTMSETKALGFERAVALLRAREFRYRERLKIAEEELERARDHVPVSSTPTRTPSSNQTILKMFLS